MGVTVSACGTAEQPALSLRYDFYGDTDAVDAIVWPADNPDFDAQALWRGTCVEVFLRWGGGPSYWEVNGAPSPAGHTAVHHFADYRHRAAPEAVQGWSVDISAVEVSPNTDPLHPAPPLERDPAVAPAAAKRLPTGEAAGEKTPSRGSSKAMVRMRVGWPAHLNAGLAAGADLDLGLSAVVQRRLAGPQQQPRGVLHYFAAEHHGAAPDFHRADAFALSLPPSLAVGCGAHVFGKR